MKFEVNDKEKLYFGIMTVIGLIFHVISCGALVVFAALFSLLRIIPSKLMIGFLKGNAIKVNNRQFPDAFEILQSHSKNLGLKKAPAMYILQGNGMLNAFATRVARKNFVVLYSDIFELAYEQGKDAVSFIIGHELGHIKRNHVGFSKLFLTFPARIVPFLSSAYSRACEYTCDNIGYNLAPKGAVNGILILASGKKLYKKVNVKSLINNPTDQQGFGFWLSEKLSTHPHIVRRLAAFDLQNIDHPEPTKDIDIATLTESANKYKPKEVQQ